MWSMTEVSEMSKTVVAAGRMGPLWGGAKVTAYIDVHPSQGGPEYLIKEAQASGDVHWDYGFDVAAVVIEQSAESSGREYTYEDYLADLGDQRRAEQKEGLL